MLHWQIFFQNALNWSTLDANLSATVQPSHTNLMSWLYKFWTYFHYSLMLLAGCCCIHHFLVILAIFNSDVLSYAAHTVTALFPQTAGTFKGVSTVHFSSLRKNFKYFHFSTWDVVMSNGNTHPLHGHLSHTNASQNILLLHTQHDLLPAHSSPFTLTGSTVTLLWRNSRNVLIIPGNARHCIFKSTIPPGSYH
jgi:hypothetical protein